MAAKMAVLVKSPERIQAVCADIAHHFQEKVAPNGLAAQVVTFDRGKLRPLQAGAGRVPTAGDLRHRHDGEQRRRRIRTISAGERRGREAARSLPGAIGPTEDSCRHLQAAHGFDAPILQAMYLDKPLRDHTLLQAICRTNRPYGEVKTHGLIVDYLGVFDDVAQAIQFDEEGIIRVVTNINELVHKLPAAMQTCLAYFPGVDRSVTGYEGLIAAQECLPNNESETTSPRATAISAASGSDLPRPGTRPV